MPYSISEQQVSTCVLVWERASDHKYPASTITKSFRKETLWPVA